MEWACHSHYRIRDLWGCGRGAAADENSPDRIPSCYPHVPLSRPASRHSSRACASLGTSRAKTLSLNGDLREGKLRSPTRARGRASASQGRRHRHGWFVNNPRRKEATATIPIVMTQRYRSCWERVRRQPCATRREHHWIVHLCPGVERKTTGAFEGDRC